jgi:CRISPR-associated protein Cmr2
MSEYLLLITLGPIQEFIAAARRTRDLWAGSQLLSDLSREAALLLRAEGSELIFPAQEDLTRHEVVNRILVTVPKSPETLGPLIEAKLREKLQNQAKTTLGAVPGLKQSGTLEHAVAQVADLLEIVWAGVARTGDYRADRENVEAALAACKNTRTFRQPSYRAMVPKSSIDGIRESVIPETQYPDRGDSDEERKRKIKTLFEHFGAGQAERLSGVDLLKRHAKGSRGESDFPSTSHFAALPWLQRYRQYNSAFDAYLKDIAFLGPERLHKQRFKALQLLRSSDDAVAFDAAVLFEERLGEDAAPDERRAAQSRLQQLYGAIGSRPEPYYAILLADGDNMGRVIDHQAAAHQQPEPLDADDNGSASDHEAAAALHRHQSFSRDLDTFAAAVSDIVQAEEHRGALVYAGGDDVLAFLPLDTVLQCAARLADLFAEQLSSYKGAKDERATLSVGIAICHHIEPLSDALDLARDAEKAAKKVKGKNALAITLSKRSGTDTTIKSSWEGEFLRRLERFIELHQTDGLPDGAAFELRALDERVGRTLAPEALNAEALRMLERKRGNGGKTAISKADLDRIATALAAGATERHPDGRPVWGVNELADELIVAREFARARGLQRPALKEQAA